MSANFGDFQNGVYAEAVRGTLIRAAGFYVYASLTRC
jgi:hypothetical protein